MIDSTRSQTYKRNITFVIVLLLWLVYTAMQTLSVTGDLNQDTYLFLGLIPGILGVGALLFYGLRREECYLQFRRPSLAGILVLIAIFILALSVVLPVGEWQGWNWRAALLLAPVGGVSQELFFRSALLPATLLILPKRPRFALLLHSLLFGLWHIGPLFIGAPLWAVFVVMLVPFLCGIGWGWQVMHDKTVVWAMVQHSLFWVIGLQFPVS